MGLCGHYGNNEIWKAEVTLFSCFAPHSGHNWVKRPWAANIVLIWNKTFDTKIISFVCLRMSYGIKHGILSSVDTVFLSGRLVSGEQEQLQSPCASTSTENVPHSESLKDLNVAFTKLHTVIHIFRQRNGTILTLFLGRNRSWHVACSVSVWGGLCRKLCLSTLCVYPGFCLQSVLCHSLPRIRTLSHGFKTLRTLKTLPLWSLPCNPDSEANYQIRVFTGMCNEHLKQNMTKTRPLISPQTDFCLVSLSIMTYHLTQLLKPDS